MSTAEPAGANAPVSPPTSSPATRLTWLLVITAALIAGLGSWGIVEALLNRFKDSFEPVSKPYPSAEDFVRIDKAHVICGTIAFGAIGGLLAMLAGLAAGISRHSAKAGAVAGLVGLLIGVLAEAGVTYVTLTVFYKYVNKEDMLQTLLSQEALWAVVGIVTGATVGLGLGGRLRWLRASIGGLVGVSLAVIAYQVAAALAFPTDGSHYPIPESIVTRAIAYVVIPLGAAAGAILASRDPKPKAKPSATPVPESEV